MSISSALESGFQSFISTLNFTQQPQETNSHCSNGCRIALGLLTLGISEAVRWAITKYKANSAESFPQVYQQQVYQSNLEAIDCEIHPGKESKHPGATEDAIADSELYLEALGGPCPRDFLLEALYEVRQNIRHHHDPLTRESLRHILYETIKTLAVERLLKEEAKEELENRDLSNDDRFLTRLMKTHHQDIQNLLSCPPNTLRRACTDLINKMCITAENLELRDLVVDNCLTTGLKAIITAIMPKHVKSVLSMPRGPILGALDKESEQLEADIYKQNNGNPAPIPEEVYETYLKKTSDDYFSNIIEVAILANGTTGNPEQTCHLLSKAMLVVSAVKDSITFTDSSQLPKEAAEAIMKFYEKLIEEAEAEEVFGILEWEELDRKTKDLFLHITCALLTRENKGLAAMCAGNAYRMKCILEDLDKKGLQITGQIANTRVGSVGAERLFETSKNVSGAMKLIGYFLKSNTI